MQVYSNLYLLPSCASCEVQLSVTFIDLIKSPDQGKNPITRVPFIFPHSEKIITPLFSPSLFLSLQHTHTYKFIFPITSPHF